MKDYDFNNTLYVPKPEYDDLQEKYQKLKEATEQAIYLLHEGHDIVGAMKVLRAGL